MSEEATATVDAVAQVLAGARAEDVVPEVLRALPGLDDRGRGRVARRVYGVCVLRARLGFLAGAGDADALIDAYLRFEEEGAPVDVEWPADPRERMCVERSCPRPLVDALVDSLGLEGADAFLRASNAPGPRFLRANTLKITREGLVEALAAEGIRTSPGRAPHGVRVEGRANLFGSKAWRAGLFEVQDEGSQLVALACAPAPGDVVVDLCAGRGGKTLALAALMDNRGALHVHDVSARALADMKPRLTRAGVTCVREGLPPPGSADVVLVDAPCSSVGTLRRSPDLRFSLDLAAEVPRQARLQRAILDEAAALLRPGGRLVYATCTVLREENDAVVEAFLASVAAGAFHLVERRLLLPHVEGTDGFFVAVLESSA